MRVYEVPISDYGRDYSEGEKITWKDGVLAVFTLFRFWIGIAKHLVKALNLKIINPAEGIECSLDSIRSLK